MRTSLGLGAHQDVAPLVGELDLVLSTSRTEGLPVAMIEAGAAGLPVAALDVGGVGEVVAHERTGWLADTTDDLAFGVDGLLGNPDERRAMGHRARLRVRDRYSALAHRIGRSAETRTARNGGQLPTPRSTRRLSGPDRAPSPPRSPQTPYSGQAR